MRAPKIISFVDKSNFKMKSRICFVNPPVLIKRPISELIYKLSAKGYKTSLLMPKKLFRKRDESLHHSKLAEKSRIYTYSIINPPLGSEQPLPVTPVFCINVFKALKNNDIIHMWVPYYLTSLKIIFLKKIFFPRKKLILTMDTVPGYSFSMGAFWNSMFKIYNKLFGWLLFGTPQVITLYGKSLVPYAIKAGVPKEKIRVIPTGIDINNYAELKSKKSGKIGMERLRKELGISPNTSIVTYAGLIVPRKGIDKIIRIADKLRKEDAVFILAGDGPKRNAYAEEARKLGLEKKIFFLGWRKDMPEIYADTDIFLLPAEGEGLPGVVMEAMAAGIPCVASNIPCIPDLIENGKSGFLCNKNDTEEFANKTGLLLRRKEFASRMGANAKARIKRFEWSNVIKEYEGLYQ